MVDSRRGGGSAGGEGPAPAGGEWWPSRPRRSIGAEQAVGIVIIVVGLIWLLSSLNIRLFDWGVTWPIALVAVGGIIIWAAATSGRGESTVTVPREQVGRLEVRLSAYAGRLALRGGAQALVEAHSRRPDLELDVRRREADALVRLRVVRRWASGGYGGADWDVALPSDVPTMLRISAGAGEFRLDLSTVQAAAVGMTLTACHADVVLPRPVGEVPIRISAGASGVDLHVPPGVEYRVTTTGLTGLDGRGESAGYATARDRVTVSVSGGASGVNVR